MLQFPIKKILNHCRDYTRVYQPLSIENQMKFFEVFHFQASDSFIKIQKHEWETKNVTLSHRAPLNCVTQCPRGDAVGSCLETKHIREQVREARSKIALRVPRPVKKTCEAFREKRIRTAPRARYAQKSSAGNTNGALYRPGGSFVPVSLFVHVIVSRTRRKEVVLSCDTRVQSMVAICIREQSMLMGFEEARWSVHRSLE